jgi:hypothetical protein
MAALAGLARLAPDRKHFPDEFNFGQFEYFLAQSRRARFQINFH